MKNLSMDTKVSAAAAAGPKPKSQPITGKLGGGMQAMPGSKGLGQMIKTVPSNPIQGGPKSSGTAMGSTAGGVIDPFV